MMKKTGCAFLVVILVIVLWLSGCQGFFPGFSTTYEAYPTKIQYDISYGYQVNSSGAGRYEITYLCDTPKVQLGSATYSILFNQDYKMQTRANNSFVLWNISGDEETKYELGLSTHVEAESFLVSDLNGKAATTREQLPFIYPSIVRKYTRLQANETTAFIDPKNQQITAIAREVQTTAKTNNTFLLAKALFAWLKTNVQYQTHPGDEGVQPAALTLQRKSGDCDDLSFLYISLCRSLGIPARFVRGYLLTAYDNGTAVAIAHAWAEVFVGGSLGRNGWIPVECACCITSIQTDIEQNFGVEDAFHLRVFTDDGSNESLTLSLSGISYVAYGITRHVQLQAFAEVRNYQTLESQKLVVNSDNTRHYE
jgi:transglutaminase-like putative cysteine protease